MRKRVSGFTFLSTLTAAIAAVSIFAYGESATGTARAAVVDPARVNNDLEIKTRGSLVSGVTGDLIIRISVAVALAEKKSSAPGASQTRMESRCNYDSCGEAAAPGTLDGDPVNSIDLVTLDPESLDPESFDPTGIDMANIDGSETNPANVNVIIAYN